MKLSKPEGRLPLGDPPLRRNLRRFLQHIEQSSRAVRAIALPIVGLREDPQVDEPLDRTKSRRSCNAELIGDSLGRDERIASEEVQQACGGIGAEPRDAESPRVQRLEDAGRTILRVFGLPRSPIHAGLSTSPWTPFDIVTLWR
jgi:hypothetical protein